jgi:hypothetical protein
MNKDSYLCKARKRTSVLQDAADRTELNRVRQPPASIYSTFLLKCEAMGSLR